MISVWHSYCENESRMLINEFYTQRRNIRDPTTTFLYIHCQTQVQLKVEITINIKLNSLKRNIKFKILFFLKFMLQNHGDPV